LTLSNDIAQLPFDFLPLADYNRGMHILLANDDGIFAPGLSAIYKKLTALGDVTVVAPADVRSGAGHSITLREPLVVNKVNVNDIFTGYSVMGSPADCVKLGILELAGRPIDLVVSGINSGANVGIDVYYSGTVAAAMEGAFYKIPSVAMSMTLEEPMDYEMGAGLCAAVLPKLLAIGQFEVMNVNIPALSAGNPKGITVVEQSQNGYRDKYAVQQTRDGRTVYMLAAPQDYKAKETELSDITELQKGYITVTALHHSMTNHRMMKRLAELDWKVDEI
jgi:5'-nucleotidase